jgi:lipoprotein-anchoring transpeptidase ErfK/SrfK
MKNMFYLILALGLAACAPDPKLIEAGVIQAPTPKLVQGAYVAQQDDGFAVPAVDTTKVPEAFLRQEVYYPSAEVVGTVVIDPTARHLYLVTGKNKAMRYGIAVGRDGFQWSGEAVITSRQHWPTWTPPPEMIDRKPELIKWEKGQPGGPDNPLGARALYLTTNGIDYGYRIHGTPEWFSIGKNASSGCIRMINQDVIDLYERVQDGAKVVVLNADGSYPTKLKLPPPAPKKIVPATVAPAPVTPAAGAPVAGTSGTQNAEMTLNPALLPKACTKPLVNGICPP